MDEFLPGELFVYTRDGDCGHMELGQVKRKVDDETYACWYSRGDTAAHTPARCMRKLANAGWSHVERDLFEDMWFEVASGDAECRECGLVMGLEDAIRAGGCPNCGVACP